MSRKDVGAATGASSEGPDEVGAHCLAIGYFLTEKKVRRFWSAFEEYCTSVGVECVAYDPKAGFVSNVDVVIQKAPWKSVRWVFTSRLRSLG
jgi:hypothetical protein